MGLNLLGSFGSPLFKIGVIEAILQAAGMTPFFHAKVYNMCEGLNNLRNNILVHFHGHNIIDGFIIYGMFKTNSFTCCTVTSSKTETLHSGEGAI